MTLVLLTATAHAVLARPVGEDQQQAQAQRARAHGDIAVKVDLALADE
jgi:hypothetical protein